MNLAELNPTATNQDANALDCDEYSLVMPQNQWLAGAHEDETSFELFVRSLPENYGYLVAAGLADALDFLARLRFTEAELQWLSGVRVDSLDPSSPPLYHPEFLQYLRNLRFTGTVHALPEGTVAGAQVPLLRITAPRIQATIVESALLATINQATAVATKAARITEVAAGKPVWDGSLRRLSGAPAGVPVARAAYLGGLTGTATVRAGFQLGIPTTGTMAHAEVQRYGEEREQDAFETWLNGNPHRAVLLVDTYDTRRGVERAIAASVKTGVAIKAIRLDSGDIAELSKWARNRLDAAGMTATRIMASGDLDEYEIARLHAAGAPVDLFLVGTKLGNPGPLGIVYKLSAQKTLDETTHFVMKRAVGKQTDPGTHGVWRTDEGQTIALSDELVPGARAQMTRVMALGAITSPQPALADIRARAAAELAELPAATRRLRKPAPLKVNRTRKLWELRARLGDPQAQQWLTPAVAHRPSASAEMAPA